MIAPGVPVLRDICLPANASLPWPTQAACSSLLLLLQLFPSPADAAEALLAAHRELLTLGAQRKHLGV